MTDTANMRQQEQQIHIQTLQSSVIRVQKGKEQLFLQGARKPVMSMHTHLWFSGC